MSSAQPCTYCHGARLVGWSGSGPILCPECSRGMDAFTVITQAWREQRARVRALEQLFDDAGEGQYNVLNLVDHYQRDAMEAQCRIRGVREVLEKNGCDCDCDHHPQEHNAACERCLACRVCDALEAMAIAVPPAAAGSEREP